MEWVVILNGGCDRGLSIRKIRMGVNEGLDRELEVWFVCLVWECLLDLVWCRSAKVWGSCVEWIDGHKRTCGGM